MNFNRQCSQFLISMLTNEIHFLRELRFCNSIISLESVYYFDENYYLVMKFAKYGSLKNLIENNMKLKESLIR